MNQILIVHGYSADNIGDGLLVYEAIRLIKKANINSKITILCSYPDSFDAIENVVYIRSKPNLFGYNKSYVKSLIGIRKYDLIVGVGGGYLRSGRIKESIGTFLTHFPQLLFASLFGKKTIYLPQSIGPLGAALGWIYRFLLSYLTVVYLRDDRSVKELNLPNGIRVPDMAILKIAESFCDNKFNINTNLDKKLPVFSVRKVKGKVPVLFFELANKFDKYDSYIQSSVGGNNDLSVSGLLNPIHVLTKNELMNQSELRVIVAVRLHAALMAIEKGHFVIHLSYERKGFSAFKDLGLEDFVFNVNDFDVNLVSKKIQQLLTDESFRKEYKNKITNNLPLLNGSYQIILNNFKDSNNLQV